MGTERPTSADCTGRRIGAGLIDLTCVLGMPFVIGDATLSDGSLRFDVQATGAILYVVLALAYYFSSEALTGTTFGKTLFDLRVVTLAGGPARTWQIGIRTALRLIDVLPLAGMLALLTTSAPHQRIGDLAAGTTVIHAPKE